jgi:hypothetical protein
VLVAFCGQSPVETGKKPHWNYMIQHLLTYIKGNKTAVIYHRKTKRRVEQFYLRRYLANSI